MIYWVQKKLNVCILTSSIYANTHACIHSVWLCISEMRDIHTNNIIMLKKSADMRIWKHLVIDKQEEEERENEKRMTEEA